MPPMTSMVASNRPRRRESWGDEVAADEIEEESWDGFKVFSWVEIEAYFAPLGLFVCAIEFDITL